MSEFRFKSPISISKLNNYLDFGRKSENYSKVKDFSDSRPMSAQKLILKVFSDFPTQIICRLSKIFNFLIWWYTRARMAFMVACLLWDKKKRSIEWTNRSLFSLWTNFWFLVVGNTVRVSLFWSIKDLEYATLLRLSDLVRARLGRWIG